MVIEGDGTEGGAPQWPHDTAERGVPTGRWRRRPVAAAVVRVGVIALPVGLSVAMAGAFESAVSKPHGMPAILAWWIGTLALATIVLLALERVARRALPLAALLRMGMLFPGVAPKRLAVARRAASTRDLGRRLDEARAEQGGHDSLGAAERIVALAASLSAHDRKTRGHTERVRALTDFIADELQLPDSDRDRLRWSALLHDIGKLAVHADILNKEGPLTEEEWELIRRHPLEGAKLTAPLSTWLGEWASTIAEHHERFDGKGYPFGLSGEQISLGGRIVAVADTYDVMTTTRSYKRASSPESARQELVRCAGTQFDPVIVRAFLGVPVRRLRGLVPLSWLGSFLFDNLGPVLSTVSKAATAGAVLASVVGVTAWRSWGPGPSTVSAQTHTSAPGAHTLASPGRRTRGTAVLSGAQSLRHDPGNAVGSGAGSVGRGAPGAARAPSDAQSAAPGPGGQGTPGATVTSTAAADGATPTTPSAPGSPGSSGTTTTAAASTTTTKPTVPAPPSPQPPTSLKVTAQCTTLGLIGPEMVLTWTRSTTASVTGYLILRSKGGAAYATIASVGATAASFSDTTVTGVGTSYSYEVEALAPGGTAASTAVAKSTVLCIL